MKSNELRIGNYVWVGKSIIKVKDIHDEGINQEIESGYYGEWSTDYEGNFEEAWYGTTNIIKPVILTETVLSKCVLKWGTDWNIKYYESKGQKIALLHDGSNRDKPFLQLDFLHQLQNFYFSMFGTELEVNL